MPIEFEGLLEDVESYQGKSGFGANITVSAKIGRKTKRLTFRTSDKNMATELEELLDQNVHFYVLLEQNSFGTRISDVTGFQGVA